MDKGRGRVGTDRTEMRKRVARVRGPTRLLRASGAYGPPIILRSATSKTHSFRLCSSFNVHVSAVYNTTACML